jgi:hypothetical protein
MKRRVNIKAVIEDIRSGVGDEGLMRKYDLPPRGLRELFKKLLDSELVTDAELYSASAMYRERIEKIKQRRYPRADLSIPLPVYDMGSSSLGVVRDISETGLCVAGIASEVGEVKSFQLSIDNLMNADPLLLVAECRWFEEKGNKEKYFVAGFQLLDLSDADRTTLQRVMQFLLLSDSGEWQTIASRDAGAASTTYPQPQL